MAPEPPSWARGADGVGAAEGGAAVRRLSPVAAWGSAVPGATALALALSLGGAADWPVGLGVAEVPLVCSVSSSKSK